MGPSNGFYKPFKEHGGIQKPMADLIGVMAVDFSILLYSWLGYRIENMMLYHQMPRANIDLIRRKIIQFDAEMKARNLQYIFILDGLAHELKYASRKREKDAIESLPELKEALENPDYDAKGMKQLMGKSCNLSRADIFAYCISVLIELGINFRVAPFEADWEITSLVMRGECSCAWSTDGDYVVLGCPQLIYSYDFEKGIVWIIEINEAFYENLTDKLFNDEVISRMTGQRVYLNRDYIIIFACLCGNDYIGSVNKKAMPSILIALRQILEGEFELAVEDYISSVQRGGYKFSETSFMADEHE